MGALLEDRVAAFVFDHPGSTVEEIARGVRSRTQAVRDVLRSGPFQPASPAQGRRDDARVWVIGSQPGDGQGRASSSIRKAGPETDKEFLLRVLADGRPHSLNEILRRSLLERGCGLTVHSRAADLRRDGHPVANWKTGPRGDGSWYQLETPEEVTAAPSHSGEAGLSAAVASSGAPADISASPGEPAGAPEQLTLGTAA